MAFGVGLKKSVARSMITMGTPCLLLACGSIEDGNGTANQSTTIPPVTGSNVDVTMTNGHVTSWRCGNMDFDLDGDANALSPGEPITDAYASWGVSISTLAKNLTTPGLAIVFDSSNPTGGDPDLGTPSACYGGPGLGNGGWSNDTSLYGLLIKAENTTDANGDGLIDVPDDDAGGAWFTFAFSQDLCVISSKVIDIEQNEVPARFFFKDANDNVINEIWAGGFGNNSVQHVGFSQCGVRTLKAGLHGSGALDQVKVCTAMPRHIDVTLAENLDLVDEVEFDIAVIGKQAGGGWVPVARGHFAQSPFILGIGGALPNAPLVSENPPPGNYTKLRIGFENVQVVRTDGSTYAYPDSDKETINTPFHVPSCGTLDIDIDYELNTSIAMNLQELGLGLEHASAVASTSNCGNNGNGNGGS